LCYYFRELFYAPQQIYLTFLHRSNLKIIRAYPNNRLVMRPSEKFEAKAAGQKCSPEVVFSTLRTFLHRQRRHRALQPTPSLPRVYPREPPLDSQQGNVSSLDFFSLPPRTTPLTYCRGSGAIERVIGIGS